MVKKPEPISKWSNTKRARVFAHIIGHLAKKHGDHGVLRIPLNEYEQPMNVGFDVEDGELIIAVDMDT